MKAIRVNLKERSYKIFIGYKIIHSLGSFIHKLDIGRDAYVITNPLIKNKYGNILEESLSKQEINVRFKLIADTERSKSIKTALNIIKDITDYDKAKKIFIIALGGGVVGDLAGFVASIYKRGTRYIQVPTTLLAQIDSSIGGKTAIDLKQGKNLIGSIYQPCLVVSDISCLETLDLKQMRSGLAEAIKYGIIKDKLFFRYIESNYKKLLAYDKERLAFLVYRCSEIKAKIIQQDEREQKGIRTILNFGHTIGHAIEAAANYKVYNHAEAISIGMVCAARLSMRLGLLKEGLFERIKGIIQGVGLPVKIKNLSISRIIEAHYRDKKFTGEQNRFVLIKDIGRPIVKKGIPLALIRDVLLERINPRHLY